MCGCACCWVAPSWTAHLGKQNLLSWQCWVKKRRQPPSGPPTQPQTWVALCPRRRLQACCSELGLLRCLQRPVCWLPTARCLPVVMLQAAAAQCVGGENLQLHFGGCSVPLLLLKGHLADQRQLALQALPGQAAVQLFAAAAVLLPAAPGPAHVPCRGRESKNRHEAAVKKTMMRKITNQPATNTITQLRENQHHHAAANSQHCPPL